MQQQQQMQQQQMQQQQQMMMMMTSPAAPVAPVAPIAPAAPALAAAGHRDLAAERAGQAFAAEQHAAARLSLGPPDGTSIYSKAVGVAGREAAWHRRELSAHMRGVALDASPLPAGTCSLQLRRTKVRRGRPHGTAFSFLLQRPQPGDYVVDGASLHVVNWGTRDNMLHLADAGLGSVPCGNPSCCMPDGGWKTEVTRWGHKSAAPRIVIGPDGRTGPLETAFSKCGVCGVASSHVDPVVLARLKNVPALLNQLPFDPSFQFNEIFLDRTFTSILDYDVITRQGVANVVEKIRKVGDESCLRIEKEYYMAGQIYWNGLDALVHKDASSFDAEHQRMLSFLCGEHGFYLAQNVDKVERLAPFGSPVHFGNTMMAANTLTERLLEVFEQRRPDRKDLMCSVGCTIACAIDFCKQTAKDLGDKKGWNLIATNEESNLLGELLVDGVSLTDDSEGAIKTRKWLQRLRQRPNFHAKVLVLDNVPPQLLNGEGVIDSKIVKVILQEMGDIDGDGRGIEHVIQDRFHVGHGFSPNFNNLDPRYFDLICKGWREQTVSRDRRAEEIVDSALRAGQVAKKVTFRGQDYVVKRGEKMDDAQINEWKELGVYHKMFSTGNVVVPEHVKSASVLKNDIPPWVASLVEMLFDAEGKPKRISGKSLIPTPEKLKQLVNNALARILNCVPPDGIDAWRKIGEQDHNGFEIYKPNFHTCGCESWNASQTAFCAGDNLSREMATGCHYEGNARQIQRKGESMGRQEQLSTHRHSEVWEVNELAGHGGDAARTRLVSLQPHAVERPPRAADAEICVQDVGSFARRSGGGKLAALRDEVPPLQLQHTHGIELHRARAQKQQQQQLLNHSTPRGAVAAAATAATSSPLPTIATSAATTSTLISPPSSTLIQSTLQGDAASGERPAKVQKKADCRANLWICSCDPVWPKPKGKAGNPNHKHGCKRKWFADALNSGASCAEPQVGDVVEMLSSAFPRAGRMSFVGPGKDDWSLLPSSGVVS